MKSLSIFDFENPIVFLTQYLKTQPKFGHGLLRKWAQGLTLHTTAMSQIMSERKFLSEEQTLELVDILNLPKLEAEYFLYLVRLQKASSKKLQSYYRDKILELKKLSQKVHERVNTDTELSDTDKAIYYSHWSYSALRIACSIGDKNGEGRTLQELSDLLYIPLPEIKKSVSFLLEKNILKIQSGRYLIGGRFTHLPAGSLYTPQHHCNWRIKSIERAKYLTEEELMYTSPFTIRKNDFPKLKARCIELIQEFQKILKSSEAEELACLNIDLFKINREADRDAN